MEKIILNQNDKCSVKEDDSNWYIDMNNGLGEATYPKEAFTLEEAISDQKNLKIE
jgi:hypothetical protein